MTSSQSFKAQGACDHLLQSFYQSLLHVVKMEIVQVSWDYAPNPLTASVIFWYNT